MTISQAFQIAFQHHQAGRLADAEALYRKILAAQANHSEALHLLGVIAHQTGRHDSAVEWIGHAVALDPNNPAAHSNLGEVYRTIGRLDEATASYRRALELKPAYPEAHNNLGNALRDQGRFDEAIAAYRRSLQIKPDLPEAHNNLANALRNLGQFDEAVSACRRALELKPEYPEAHLNLGVALAGLGRLDEAIAAYRNALRIRPDFSEAHNNLGIALAARGRFDDAIASCRHALQLKPCYPEAHYNLGNALRSLGQLDEAVAAFQRALQLKPDSPEILNDLGNTLTERGQFDEAIAAYRRVLQLKPGYPEAHNNLGAALRARGQLDASIAACRSALELRPDFPEACHNLGNALKDQGELDEAIASFRRALNLRPEFARAHGNLIYALHFHPGHTAGSISEERQRWNLQFSEPLKRCILPHGNDPATAGRLRIGYVSPDFRDHVVGRNLIPLFQRHDSQSFEIVCYSGVVRPDPLTNQFRQRAHQWRSTVGVDDPALAEMIRRDGVDILVDLTQHMAGNRLPVFARKPAPVQVSFAGYPESTGLEAIEYRISDRGLEGGLAGAETGGKERVYMIDSFWCYDPCGAEAEVNGLPAGESGAITFGCLNNFCKVNERMLKLWSLVLTQVADSRLILMSGAGSHRQRALETLRDRGVEARRVEFVEPRPRKEYLELYHRLDIVLDTFPYNGHTTSLDALWMGVPVVSLAGDTPVSRAGLSQLTNLGMVEWVAHSESEYVNIAERLAGNLPHLAKLRRTLRDRMKASALMDAPGFARQVEQAYRSMWERWLRQ